MMLSDATVAEGRDLQRMCSTKIASMPWGGVRACAAFFLAVVLGSQSFAEETPQSSSPNGSKKQVALVIGNSAYAQGALKNPVNDARAMARLLQDSGYEVVLAENAGRAKFVEAMEEFTKRLEGADIGIFYYAGHGMQIRDRNYLIPTDAKSGTEDATIDNSIDANRVLDRMGSAGARVKIIFLDACRNNPYAKAFRTEAKGLAPMDAKRAVRNTVISFATAPGAVASDGKGENGTYTKYLLKYLAEPGLAIETALKRVRASVIEETKQKQVPWESSSLVEDFSLVASAATKDTPSVSTPQALPSSPSGGPSTVAAPTTAQNNAGSDAWQRELALWGAVEDSADPADLQVYLRKYPAGTFVDLAKVKLEKLEKLAQSRSSAPNVAAASEKAPSPASVGVALPKVGDSWTYDVYVKDEFQGLLRIGVDSINEEHLTERITFSKNSAFSRERDVRLGFNTDKFVDELLKLPGGLQLPEIAPYILPGTDLAENDQWEKIPCEFSHTLLLGSRKFKCSLKVLGKEKISVPAGQFDAWKLQALSDKTDSKLMRFQLIFWYSPEISRSVKVEVAPVFVGGVSVPQVYSLKSFTRE